MVGSVWAWPTSSEGGYADESGAVVDDIESSGEASLRGGSWVSNDKDLFCSSRFKDHPFIRLHIRGFRLSLSLAGT